MFIQVIQGRCHDRAELRRLADRWYEELAPDAVGWLGATYGFTDDDTFVGVVRFDSREAAAENSRRPEQGTWWGEMERCFTGPVEFHDCADVTLMLEGGSDEARFVQVIEGKVDDPERLKSLMGQTDLLHERRPEIIGGTLAIEEDGTFVETVAFTDEESARRAEKEQPMPEEMASAWDSVTHDVAYLDLHEPWFATRR